MDIKIRSSDLNSMGLNKTFLEPHKVQQSAANDKKNVSSTANNEKMKESKLNDVEVGNLVENINTYLNQFKRKIKFKILRDFDNRTVIQVVDSEKNKVIRQIPPDYLLKIEKSLAEISGLITDERA